MFLRRLGTGPQCKTASCCPNVFELATGAFAIVGKDITAEAAAHLPSDAGCGPGERVVEIPREILVRARPDIPTNA